MAAKKKTTPSPQARKQKKQWKEILKREGRLKSMSADAVRAELDSGGFPEKLINKFFERQHDA